MEEKQTLLGEQSAVTISRKKREKKGKKSFLDYFVMQASIALILMLVVFAVSVITCGTEPLKEAFPISLSYIFTSKIT